MSEATKPLADRAALRGAKSGRRHTTVELPVNKLRIRLQSLTALEKEEWETECIATGGKNKLVRQRMVDAERRLFVLCIVGDDDQRLLGPEDVSLFVEWDSMDTECLYAEAAKHCGINKDDVEGAVKNSEGATVE